MNCPFCSNKDTQVIETRDSEEGIRRRRYCPNCKTKFTTYEKPKLDFPIVVKKDGRREEFSSQKILQGIKKACEKRPISIDDMLKIVKKIEKYAIESGKSEITTEEIGNIVIEELKKLDKVAYVRFASVYKEFKDVTEFFQELQELIKEKKKEKREKKKERKIKKGRKKEKQKIKK